MGQYWSSTEGVTCSKKTALKTAWKISDSDDVDQIVTMKVQTANTELTALLIACLNNDVELVTKLIKKGADINLVSKDKFTYSSMSPIYCAATNDNVQNVKILIEAGADINSFQGLRQCVIAPDRRAIIGPNRFWYLKSITPTYDSDMILKVLELYLYAGVKLNTTSWGPCLFLGRGKVYETNSPSSLGIPGPWFICTSAILLLQHGVDPNLYKLGDVLRQKGTHGGIFRRYYHDNDDYCTDLQTFMATFLAAGYDLTTSDLAPYEKSDYLRTGTNYQLVNAYGRTPSLKQLVRAKIRKHIRSINKDTSVFPIIDKLQLPPILKDFLKLYDVSPSDPSSIICFCLEVERRL